MDRKIYTDIFKSFSRLITGSALGYAFVLLLSPFLTRIYSPEDFGKFSLYGALIAIFSILATLSFEFAIVGSRRRSEALRFSLTSTAIAFFVLISSITLITALSLSSIFIFKNEYTEVIFACIGCFLAVLTNIEINWAIRNNKSSVAAFGTFLSLSLRSILQIALGYAFGGLYGLILGDILGRLFSYLSVESGVLSSSIKKFIKKKSLIFRHIKKNTQYIFHLTPANAIETSLVWLSAPLFSLYYDPFIGGIVAMVQRIAFAPISMLNQTLGQIFHYYISSTYDKNNDLVIRYVILIFLTTLPILFFLLIIFGIYGKDISEFIFGEKWGDAGEVIFILLPLYYMYFLSLMTSKLIIIMSRNYIKLISSVIQLFFLLVSLPLALLFKFNWKQGMILQSLTLALIQLIALIFVLWLVRSYPKFGSICTDSFFSRRI